MISTFTSIRSPQASSASSSVGGDAASEIVRRERVVPNQQSAGRVQPHVELDAVGPLPIGESECLGCVLGGVA